jgi:hypothetical protein
MWMDFLYTGVIPNKIINDECSSLGLKCTSIFTNGNGIRFIKPKCGSFKGGLYFEFNPTVRLFALL